MLANNKNMAKTSSAPGRTRLVNYFEVNKEFYLVDLPGYGYAKLSKTEKDSWDSVLGSYFDNAENLKLVLVLLDCRHLPSELDILMLNYLVERDIKYRIVLTKADKLSKSELNNNIKKISDFIRHNKEIMINTSSDKKQGRDEIAKAIEDALK